MVPIDLSYDFLWALGHTV